MHSNSLVENEYFIAVCATSNPSQELLTQVEEIIKTKNIDEKNAALHFAAKHNSIASAKLLIENGAEINSKDINGTALLYIAARNNSIEIVKLLIESGTNVNVKDKDNYGGTPLHIAAIYESIELAKLLIENGADINIKNELGNAALHLSTMHSSPRIELIKLLIENGANINDKNNDGLTPLHIAALHEAVSNDSIELVKLLIKNGIDINIKNNANKTALHLLTEENILSISVIKLLIENGADLTILKDIFNSSDVKFTELKKDLFFQSIIDLHSLQITSLAEYSGENKKNFEKLLENISPKEWHISKEFFNQLIDFVQNANVKLLLRNERENIYNKLSHDFRVFTENQTNPTLFNKITISQNVSFPDVENGRGLNKFIRS